MLVARETIWLSREHRGVVDTELADRLPELGDWQVETECKKIAYRLDPHAFLARARAAERDRRVSLRPAPDTMARLSALLPAAQGVACYAALSKAADTLRASGDERTRGQQMADTLVGRVTGQTTADAVPVTINLVMTDTTLFKPADPTAETAAADQTAKTCDATDRATDADQANDADAAADAGAAADGGGPGCAGNDESGQDNSEDGDDAADGAHDDVGCSEADDPDDEADDAHDDNLADDENLADDDDLAHDDEDAEFTDEPDQADAAAADAGYEPAYLVGYGPLPAGIARQLARSPAQVWLRRVFLHPETGQLAALDRKRRLFDKTLREAIILRDQVCRTPWCAAPIRHPDHAIAFADGGVTSLANGQGLCEACNYTKQAHGWSARPGPGGTSESVTLTTPTGHTYPSWPPDLPGAQRIRRRPGRRAGPANGRWR
jgi:hypothetical protein